MKYNNDTNINPVLACWAIHSDYDGVIKPYHTTATTLTKPIQELIHLYNTDTNQIEKEIDVTDLINSRLGTALHDSIEVTFKKHHKKLLPLLGFNPDKLNIILEERRSIKIDKWTITGKCDAIINGILHDYKSCAVISYLNKSNIANYKLQASIYKLLFPEIKYDYFKIAYIFTDWNKLESLKKSEYPNKRTIEVSYPFLGKEEITQYIQHKTNLIEQYKDKPIDTYPQCTEEDLWQSPTTYKYFSNPNNKRATKSFDNSFDAYNYLSIEGKGEIREVKGVIRRCKYCSALNTCHQAKLLDSQNLLVL